MRLSVKNPAAVAAAALALAVAAPATSDAAPLLGHAHRTVTAGGATYELDLLAAPAVLPPGGGTVFVAGTGYNRAQGIFLAFCAIPGAVRPGNPATYTTLPTPCLGGREAKDGSARRITDSDGGTPGITLPYGPGGSFVTTLNVRPRIADGVECDVDVRCAIVTRADFTATGDRSYDQYVPVSFRR